MSKIFLSYATKDREVAKKLSDLLFQDGVDVWIDQEKILGGRMFPEKIGNGIAGCEAFILLWSKAASESRWVKEEWQCALNQDRLIVPCILDDTPLPPMLRFRSPVDLSNFGEGYRSLLKAFDLEPKIERVHIAEAVRVEIEKPKSNELQLVCNPSAGGTGLITKATLLIKANAKKVSAFGFDLSVNPSFLVFEGVEKGSLTEDWAGVNGNQLRPGELRLGGFAGGGESIREGNDGTIAAVKLRVTFLGGRDGAKSRISISNLMDDIAGMNLSPSSVEFTYEK